MKKLPIGIDDFKKLIEKNAYYIDKTEYIEKILDDISEVKLFIRPRRFGKTLNMLTLKYFFDIENKEENRKLFKNLYIEKKLNFLMHLYILHHLFLTIFYQIQVVHLNLKHL